jgi:asparagine synthase (glutamine-hydrolysing)
MYHYLTFMTTPAPSTLFRDIKKIPAGHMLTVQRNGEIRMTQYWDALPSRVTEARTEAEHRAEILRLLRESIRKRMMSDVPFGVFLSGGVDSSANVALMSEQMSRPVDTFTVGFSDADYLNELESARRIADRYNTNHHEVIISEKEMQDFLPSLVFHQDEPIADPVCVPLYYVSKLARDSGTVVVQVGEGADEIFSGYENYVRHLRIYENFWRYAERTPQFLRRAASSLMRPAVEITGKKRQAGELLRRLSEDEPLFWGGAVIYDEPLKRQVLSKEISTRFNGRSSLQTVQSYLDHIEEERPDSDFLTRMTYLELKLRLPELLLMRVDKITMATSVEARVPFLDHHLVEWANALRAEVKLAGGQRKALLKRLAARWLPEEIIHRRKVGFEMPLGAWLRRGGALAHRVQALRDRDSLSGQLVERAQVERLIDEHDRGAANHADLLWSLVALDSWGATFLRAQVRSQRLPGAATGRAILA